MQQVQQKRKILQHCWRDQLVSALKALVSSASLCETTIWGPWLVPRCSTECLYELLNWDWRGGACKIPQERGAAHIFHKEETLKEENPVAWCLEVYCCKHMCLTFPICKIIVRASSLHEMCLEIVSIKSCSKPWGDTWLCPGNTWELSKCPLESEAKFTCLQESGCAFPEKISWLPKKGISINSPQGTWQCLQH